MAVTNSHFIRDLPPIWEHTGARVVPGEYIDSLLEPIQLESGGERIPSPLARLADDSRSKHLWIASEVGVKVDRGFTDRLLAQRT